LLARNGTDITGVTQGKFSLSGHTHAQYLTGYTLQCSAVTACTNGLYAAAVHTHAISGVTGLQAALDAKSGTGHTHSTYATKASVQTYTGTTAPATYVPKLMGIKTPTGTSYTFIASDCNKLLLCGINSGTEFNDYYIPTGLSVGFNVTLFRTTTEGVRIVPNSGVTLICYGVDTNGFITMQYGWITLVQVATNSWVGYGLNTDTF